MKSKTKAKKQAKRKTNPSLLTTLALALKNPKWKTLAGILSGPTRKYSSVNLYRIEKETKEGDTIIIPGKVLSSGELTKKIRICSLTITPSAKSKLSQTSSEYATIAEEIKKNSKAEGIKILR